MTFTFRDNIENMQGYTPGFQPDDPNAIKINTNENPYPPSPRVFKALCNLSDLDLQRYPRILWDEFRQVAARLHNLPPAQILCGNGGDELLAMLVRCCCDENRALAYPTPTYTLYPILAQIQNCPTFEIPWTDDYRIPPALAETDAPLTFPCNPHAPTTTFVPIDDVAGLARRLTGILAVDEAYVDFAPDNAIRLLDECDNLFILRSLSKGYSLAGLRFGYGLTSPRIADALIKVKDSYNVNVATQTAAAAALADQDHFRRNVQNILQQRDRLTAALRNLGFMLPDSHTNFLLADTAELKLSAHEIYQELAQRNIFIRYFNTEGLSNRLRITVGAPGQNDTLLAALVEILK